MDDLDHEGGGEREVRPEAIGSELSDDQIRLELEKDKRFLKSFKLVENQVLGHWNKFMKSREGAALKKAYSRIDQEAIALKIAANISYRNGVDVYRHNLSNGNLKWDYGIGVSYESVARLFKIQVEKMAREDIARNELPVILEDESIEDKSSDKVEYREYSTDDINYELTGDKYVGVEKWRGGNFLKGKLFDLVHLFGGSKERVAEAYLVMDFPAGPLNILIERTVRDADQVMTFSFQERGGRVVNHEIIFPNKSEVDLDLTKIFAKLEDIVGREVAYRKQLKSKGRDSA